MDGAVMDSRMMFGDIVAKVCCPRFLEMAELALYGLALEWSQWKGMDSPNQGQGLGRVGYHCAGLETYKVIYLRGHLVFDPSHLTPGDLATSLNMLLPPIYSLSLVHVRHIATHR